MIFTSAVFAVFLMVTLAVYWCLPRRPQNVFLLIASYVFYGYVHPWFGILLAASTVADYGFGLAMTRWPAHRKPWIVFSLVSNLGLLGVFKYYNFFATNVQTALASLGLHLSLPMLQVMLPVGLSFYTFQSLSYTIDVYRGHLRATRNLVDFALFVSLFPQLVAGPIERATNLLPQIQRNRSIDFARIESGVCLIVWGYFVKLVIADNLALYTDRILTDAPLAGPVLLAGGISFLVQLLADFGGYTDIARGTGRLFGFELMRNFDRPFSASNVALFWQRWHMSLSSWIRDYVFYALPNARRSKYWMSLHAVITMTLFGFWHGADWNFLAWGLFSGLCVAAYYLVFRALARALAKRIPRWIVTGLGIGLTFMHTIVIALLFRQHNISTLRVFFTRDAFTASAEGWYIALGTLGVVLALSTPLLLRLAFDRWIRASRLARIVLAWVCVAAIVFLGREGDVSFIYFAF